MSAVKGDTLYTVIRVYCNGHSLAFQGSCGVKDVRLDLGRAMPTLSHMFAVDSCDIPYSNPHRLELDFFKGTSEVN